MSIEGGHIRPLVPRRDFETDIDGSALADIHDTGAVDPEAYRFARRHRDGGIGDAGYEPDDGAGRSAQLADLWLGPGVAHQVDLDIAGAEQGWLRLDANGVDWQPLAAIGDWKGSPRPSDDHNPGVRIDLMCDTWPEPKVRELRASSHAVKRFVERVALAAGDIADGKAVRVQLTGARVVKIGKGSSVDIDFDIAPPERWPDVAAFDAHRGDDAAADGASANFADMPDSPLDGPVGAAADEWA